MKRLDATEIGLRASDIEQINAIFARYPEIDEVILYGSRARGNYRQGSDIDLTVMSATLTERQLADIETEVDDLLLPYKLDLSLYRSLLATALMAQIQESSKMFFKKT